MDKFFNKKIKRETTLKKELIESLLKSFVTTFMVCFFIFFQDGALPQVLLKVAETNPSTIEWFFVLFPFVLVMHLWVSFTICLLELNKKR